MPRCNTRSMSPGHGGLGFDPASPRSRQLASSTRQPHLLEVGHRASRRLRQLRFTLARQSVSFARPGRRGFALCPERRPRCVVTPISAPLQLVERIDFDLLFRWFAGLGVDDPIWDATSFTKNRDRLLAGEIAGRFLAAVLAQPKVGSLLSTEHISVDGTLLEAWASTRSFRPKDGSGPPPDAGRNGEQDFHGRKRSNETHASTTDPDARLFRKGAGKEAKLCFMGHALMGCGHCPQPPTA
jgi:hypothetical protein